MKIAIMGAMEEEIENLINQFGEEITQEEYGRNTFYLVKYENIELIITNSGIGKVFSTITATTLIEKYGCEMLLFTGVAGGIKEGLKVGDLVVANKLCQHDLDITAFGHPYGYVPGLDIFIEPTKDLIELVKEVSKKNNINIIEGTIATGDQFVHSTERREFVIKEFDASALEMEGASVAVVCDTYKIPFLILRSISDTASEEANVDFNEFLKMSAKRSANLILNLVQEIQKENK